MTQRRALGLFACACFAAAFLGCATSALAAWPFAHSNSANTGYVGVVTAPAGAGSVSVPNIGTFALGAGPVVADDGTVYVGNQQGTLTAFRDDGTPLWTAQLDAGESIVSSPLISNGHIFVVGVTQTSAALYRFDSAGGRVSRTAFPHHAARRIKTAAPNVLKVAPSDIIVIPVLYENAPVYESRLIMILEQGAVVADNRVSVLTPTTTADSFGTTTIEPSIKPKDLPLPMAAIYRDLSGRPPVIVVADGMQSVVGYAAGDGSYLFPEIFRYTDTTRFRSITSTPTIMVGLTGANDGFIVNSSKGLLSANPAIQGAQYSAPNQHSADAPSLIGGHFNPLVVWKNELVIVEAGSIRRIQLAGESFVSPAVSQNLFYVSSADAFTTFSVQGFNQVARFDWVGGGLNPPVIGPKGHVYAIASNILFIFPPPKTVDAAVLLQKPVVKTFDNGANAQAPQAPQPAATLPPSQLYHPPLTTSGNRLFACEELDQDDCGKGDHKDISLAWCQKQGYPKVKGYDVDSRKVRAETLDGRFCAKNKCKVFDSIACEM